MQKSFIFLVLFLVVAAPLTAQMKLGLKAGGNFSYSRTPNFEGTGEKAEARYGWQAGISAIKPLGQSQNFELAAELLYAQKGGGWRFDGNNAPSGSFIEDYHYLCLPVALNVLLKRGFSLNGGLEAAYLLDKSPDLVEVNRLDLGLLIGTSFRFNPETYLNLRYVFGLVGPLEFTPTDSNGEPYRKFRNDLRSIQLSFVRYISL